MNYYDFNCYEVYYDGDIAYYCTRCLPSNVSNDMTRPIFQDMELDSFPVCEKCGKEHDYMGLTDFGVINHPDGIHTNMFETKSCGKVYLISLNTHDYFCLRPNGTGNIANKDYMYKYNSKIIRRDYAIDLFREKLDCGNDMLSDEIFDLLLEKALDNIESEEQSY